MRHLDPFLSRRKGRFPLQLKFLGPATASREGVNRAYRDPLRSPKRARAARSGRLCVSSGCALTVSFRDLFYLGWSGASQTKRGL
jgi:hypothetical protein